jgi:uncharacterized protein (TIGR02996 family)
MSDEKALLSAIWEHPHEDTPRLMYADWLQEHGGKAGPARAEFIRVQCELARLDEWDDGFAALKAREQSLLKAHARKWLAQIPKEWRKSPFHRGFLRLDLSEFEFEKLIRLTVRQLSVAPLARYHYNLKGSHFNRFLKWPGAVFQDLFAPRPPLPKGWADRLAACEYLKNVSEVAFICGLQAVLTADEVRVILDTWADRHLTSLCLVAGVRDEKAQGVDDDTFQVMAGHPTMAKVQQLELRRARPTRAGLRTLFRSPFLTNLRDLDPNRSAVGNAGLIELARSPLLSRLRKLSLYEAGVGDAGVVALANSPASANLRWLHLGDNRIGPVGFLALARSPHLGGLTYLELRNNPGCRDAAAVKELRARFGHLADFRV